MGLMGVSQLPAFAGSVCKQDASPQESFLPFCLSAIPPNPPNGLMVCDGRE